MAFDLLRSFRALSFFCPSPWKAPAERLYDAVLTQSRARPFYAHLGVPDTVEGRFDLLTLHVHLLFRRLKEEGEAVKPLNQAVFDHMFSVLEQAMRQQGVGDLRVGKKVRELAEMFYGRATAYEAALHEEPEMLVAALAKNIFGDEGADGAAPLARYVHDAVKALDDQDLERLTAGDIHFPDVEDLPVV